MRRALLLGLLAFLVPVSSNARAGQVPAKYRPHIRKGLEWLAKQQSRDGHYEARGGQYPVAMTALAGMAFLCEGSTIQQGKYATNIRRVRDWLMLRSQSNGLIGDPRNRQEAARYMYGHGFATLFLSCVYGGEIDVDRRRKLQDILTRAVQFCRQAQTRRGGWGYVSAKDGRDFDEGSVTVTQVQALRAARNAGIPVPVEAIKDSQKYLEASTAPDGGVRYSLANGGGGSGRPALTAAAIACGFSTGDYNSPLVKKWFKFCESRLPLSVRGARFGHDEYTHYYYAQALYLLGDEGWARLFPQTKGNGLSWQKYRDAMFDSIVGRQTGDGSFSGGNIGTVYVTSLFLTILQLENGCLPIYQR
jgi:hypothetical protein